MIFVLNLILYFFRNKISSQHLIYIPVIALITLSILFFNQILSNSIFEISNYLFFGLINLKIWAIHTWINEKKIDWKNYLIISLVFSFNSWHFLIPSLVLILWSIDKKYQVNLNQFLVFGFLILFTLLQINIDISQLKSVIALCFVLLYIITNLNKFDIEQSTLLLLGLSLISPISEPLFYTQVIIVISFLNLSVFVKSKKQVLSNNVYYNRLILKLTAPTKIVSKNSVSNISKKKEKNRLFVSIKKPVNRNNEINIIFLILCGLIIIFLKRGEIGIF